MNSPTTFSCKVEHPGVFPSVFFLDPFEPLKVKTTVRISAHTLYFLSSNSEEDRILGRENFVDLGPVAIKHITGGEQRLEVLYKSLRRMALVASLAFAFFLIFRPYGVGVSVLAGLAAAAVVGPLHFLLRGGLVPRDEVVRFHFTPLEKGKPFYLETELAKEAEILAALVAGGLRFDEQLDSQQPQQLGG
jgi:hypothetical protein